MPPARNYLRLRPAPPLDSQHKTQRTKEAKEQAAKRKVTEVACQACRTRKSKCDGANPQCATCIKRGTECIYLGIENAQTLRRKYHKVRLLLQSHQELYDIIRNRSAEEGFEIMHQIRVGHDINAILRHIRDGDLQAHNSSHQSVAMPAPKRPSIQALLDSADVTLSFLNPAPSSGSHAESATDTMSILALCRTDPSMTKIRQ
ncbi:hypothetical protein PG989_001164 [Apiospora arundinis]